MSPPDTEVFACVLFCLHQTRPSGLKQTLYNPGLLSEKLLMWLELRVMRSCEPLLGMRFQACEQVAARKQGEGARGEYMHLAFTKAELASPSPNSTQQRGKASMRTLLALTKS